MGRDRRRKMIATANATKERETQKETWGGQGVRCPVRTVQMDPEAFY